MTNDQDNNMAIKITSKIVDYEVAKPDAQPQPPQELQAATPLEEMHEKLKRPETLRVPLTRSRHRTPSMRSM